MKALHAITTLSTIIWFGRTVPCTDPYHDGYPEERVLGGNNHESCAQNYVMAHWPSGTTVAQRCTCRTCISNTASNSHYYLVPVAVANRPNLSPRRCPECTVGMHPIPEARQS